MKYIDFVFKGSGMFAKHPKGATNFSLPGYEMLIAFRLLTNGEDYQVYRNTCIYSAAPNMFIFN